MRLQHSATLSLALLLLIPSLLRWSFLAAPPPAATADSASGDRILASATVAPLSSATLPPPPSTTPLVSGALRLEAPHATGCSNFPVTAHFTATSLVDLVDGMRVVEPDRNACDNPDEQLRGQAWESFALTRTYAGSGEDHYYYLSAAVQFRDRQGNVSSVYCTRIQGVCYGTQTPLPPISPTSTARPAALLPWVGGP